MNGLFGLKCGRSIASNEANALVLIGVRVVVLSMEMIVSTSYSLEHPLNLFPAMPLSLPAPAPSSASALATPAQDVTKNAAMLYLLTLGTKQSRSKMQRLLSSAAKAFGYPSLEACPWGELRAVHLLTIKASMEQQEKSPNTINLVLSALRGVARQAWSLGQISDHEERVISAVKGSRGKREGREEGRALSRDETRRLLTHCDEAKPKGLRDALIISLGVASGLRRTEIAGMRLKDVDEADRTIRIIGKGNKQRRVYPSAKVWDLLQRWLAVRGTNGTPFVFCPVLKGGRIADDREISGDTVYQMLRILAEEAEVGAFSPHDLRRTFATRMFEAGADINIVRQAMGHASVLTTQRYDKRAAAEVKRYASSIEV